MLKNRIFNFCGLVFTLSVLLVVFSCKNKKASKGWEEYVNKMVTEWNNKELKLPKDTIVLNSTIKSDSSLLKLVIYIDGTCSVCISELSFWKEFIAEANAKGLKCKFLIYVYVEDVENLKKYLAMLNFNYPIVIDSKSQFPQMNNLQDKRFQTLLVNINNRVILIGSPTMNSNLRETYLATIQMFNNPKSNIKQNRF